MMPPNLRTVITQYRGGRSIGSRRNFSSSTNSHELKGARKIARNIGRVISFGVGFNYLGPFIFGDQVAVVEDRRQKFLRQINGESAKIVDLREKMWLALREMMRSVQKS